MNLKKINELIKQGMDLFHEDRYEEGLEYFDRVIEVKPDYTTFVWYFRGESLKKLGRYEEARHCYDMIIEMAPESKSSWCYKGDFLFYIGEYEESVEYYDKVLELGPSYSYAEEQRKKALKKIK